MGKKRGGGSAQTLRDYWAGHGHAGPSHGAERDAIGWGTPGDFDRCVAQVTAHGHMTEEQAKGYCNLRHHDALGYYPATHARMEGKGVDLLTKAADGGAEARVPPGKVTGGQFTVGGDGPSTAPKKPNPYADGKKKTGPGKTGPGKTGGAKKPSGKAAIRARLKGLRGKLSGLEAEEKSLKAKLPKAGASSAATGTNTATTNTAQNSQASQSSSSQSSQSSSKPGSSIKQQLSQVQAQIKQVKMQIKSAEQQLAAKAIRAEAVKSARNPRDTGSGRYRTFEGEVAEAQHAFSEGRVGDVIDLLGSAQVLTDHPLKRVVLGQLQGSLASRVTHTVVPDAVKSFIRGDSIAHGGKTGFHEGNAGGGHVYMRTRDGVRYRVPAHEVRAASDDENEDLYRQETDPGLPEPPEEKPAARHTANKVGPHGYSHGWIKADGPALTFTARPGPASHGMHEGDALTAYHSGGTVTGLHAGPGSDAQHTRLNVGGQYHDVPNSSLRRAVGEEVTEHRRSALDAARRARSQPAPMKGDTIVHNGRIAMHDGSAGKGNIRINDGRGNTDVVPKSEVRPATSEENAKLMGA